MLDYWLPMVSDPVVLFANWFLYFYESNSMNELKKNDLIKARKLYIIFRFIDDSISIIGGGEFQSIYCRIYLEELEIGKKIAINLRLVFWMWISKQGMEGFKLASLIKATHFYVLLSEGQTSQVMYHLL